MLAHGRHSDSKDGKGTEFPTQNNESGEENNHFNDGTNLLVQKKDNSDTRRCSGNTGMLSFFGRMLSKRYKHKKKIASPSSQLMRTISIHHLECNDYVPSVEVNQMASDRETSKVVLSYHHGDSITTNGHGSLAFDGTCADIGKQYEATGTMDAANDFYKSNKLDKLGNNLLEDHMILKEKITETRDALLKQQDANPMLITREFAIQSKFFLDMLELFNANREALLDSHEDPNSVLSYNVKGSQAPFEAGVLKKSFSFPALEFSGSASGIHMPSYKRIDSDSLVNHKLKSLSRFSSFNKSGVATKSEVLPFFHEFRKQREATIVLNHMSYLKQRIRNVILDNRKERQRISRDRVLHKVPFGQEIPEGENEKLFCQDEGGKRSRFGNISSALSNNKHVLKSIQRSRSLTESLDMYSQLLQSISINEHRKAPDRSKSVHEDSILQQGKFSKNFGRMLSNPEFRSYSFSKDVHSEGYKPFQSSKILIAEPLVSEMERTKDELCEMDTIKYKLNSDTIIPPNSEQEKARESYLLSTKDKLCEMDSTTNKLKSDTIIPPSSEQEGAGESDIIFSAEAMGPNKLLLPIMETTISETIRNQGYQDSVNECACSEQFQLSNVPKESDLVNEHETNIEDDLSIQPRSPGPISSLDSNVVEVPSSQAKCSISVCEPQPRCIDSEEQHQFTDLPNKIDRYGPNFADLSKSDYEQRTRADDHVNSFLVHVDHRSEATCNFVRYIMIKFETSLGEPFLHDLINEVLLHIYEYSTAPRPWLLQFHSKNRSMPAGTYLFDEVQAEISWHVSSTLGIEITLDDLVARDFSKNDGWMNLYREAESVGLQLEHLIMDDILNEMILGFDGF